MRLVCRDFRRFVDKHRRQLPIHEGPVFRIRDVTITGALVPIHLELGLARGDIATRERLHEASERVEHAIGMDASVIPFTHIDVATGQLDLTFEIQWRWLWDAVRSLHSP